MLIAAKTRWAILGERRLAFFVIRAPEAGVNQLIKFCQLCLTQLGAMGSECLLGGLDRERRVGTNLLGLGVDAVFEFV